MIQLNEQQLKSIKSRQKCIIKRWAQVAEIRCGQIQS
ncbi:unnamed protein product [Paramecium primaurelia]|uniref:Uncharacterized protein n=1 Tax=Paramecium primaurelia TaxID=5886 RepID=A0A8S1NFF2_PARPR|nr:unnamed protein product [Paramecium primaurelia]